MQLIKKDKMKIYNKKYILVLLCFVLSNIFLGNASNAELSYNFTNKKKTNGLTDEQRKTLKYYFENNDDGDYNNGDEDDKNEEEKKQKPTGDKENEVKINIGGLVDAQYFYTYKPSEYREDILLNGMPQSPAEIQNYSIVGNRQHVLNMLGKLTINPEFVRYKTTDGINKIAKERLLTVGAKISLPFYNNAHNTDPRLAPEEYIYIKTKYLHFQIGATQSAGAKMKVDASNIASGNGGVFGTWWRYVSLPVFNTTGMSPNDRAALNAMSPTYILFPGLPNEAGFTVQRALVRGLSNEDFVGGNPNNLAYGGQGQTYPTQGAYSNKIAMYLPRVKGFSIGVSYSPNTQYGGFVDSFLNKDAKGYENVSGGYLKHYTSVAIDYKKQWDKYGLGVAFSASYEYGKYEPVKYNYNTGDNNYVSLDLKDNLYIQRNDLNAFSIGAKLVYKNYSIAYSFGYWGKSLLNKYPIVINGNYQIPNQDKSSHYHTAGIGANYGPVRIGLTYMHSVYSGNKLDVLSLGTDFKMMSLKYLKVNPYFELTGYIFSGGDKQLIVGDDKTYSPLNYKGIVTTLGIRIIF